MKNIELKIKIGGFKNFIVLLRLMGARNQGTFFQHDTYYYYPDGRLKVREINKEKGEMIFYRRQDIKSSKISDYRIIPFVRSQLKKVKADLKRRFGEEVCVKKKRALWIYQNTRIHLDKVIGLGNFLELETVVSNTDIKKAITEHHKVMRLLKLSKYEKINVSYSNLLS